MLVCVWMFSAPVACRSCAGQVNSRVHPGWVDRHTHPQLQAIEGPINLSKLLEIGVGWGVGVKESKLQTTVIIILRLVSFFLIILSFGISLPPHRTNVRELDDRMIIQHSVNYSTFPPSSTTLTPLTTSPCCSEAPPAPPASTTHPLQSISLPP